MSVKQRKESSSSWNDSTVIVEKVREKTLSVEKVCAGSLAHPFEKLVVFSERMCQGASTGPRAFASSLAARMSSCLGRRNRTCPVTLLAVHAASGHEAECGGSFRERSHTRLPLYGAVRSAPPHAAPRSSSGKQEDRMLAALALAAAA